MSLSTLTKFTAPVVSAGRWIRQHPYITVGAIGGTTLVASIIRLYIHLYQRHVNRYEFIPPVDEKNIFWRYIRNTCRFTWAIVRYRFMTIDGCFPPNVHYYSALMEKSITRKPDLRPLFVPAGNSIDIFPCSSVHSHPRSAEFRSSSNAYLSELVRKAGYEPYSVSSSRRDEGDGSRMFYCTKDFGIPFRSDPIRENHVFIFTDVDYYADMPRWLALWKPICMYSLVPDVLNYSNDEYSFQFVGGKLQYHVSGGGQYEHQLWDYKGDTVTTVDIDGNLLVFDIEQRQIHGDDQHRLIWLLPKARISDPLWICAYTDWRNCFLQRKVVGTDGVNTLWEPISDKLSIGLEGQNYSVTLDGKLFEAIRTRVQYMENKPYISDVERLLKEAKHNNYVKDAPIIFKCLPTEITIRPNVVKTGSFPTNFMAIPKRPCLTTVDGKMPGQVTSTPLVSSPALMPSKTYNDDAACIEGRLEKVRNNKRFPPKYRRYADEFVRMLIPDKSAGTGIPSSIGEVREAQDKKSQRCRFDRVAPSMSIDAENKIKSFIKTEPYSSAKAPRNISTMTPEITIQSSAFSLPMAKVLKTHKWYCPGKKPRDIVDRLHDVMQMDLDHDLEEGDYTCLDGTQSQDYSELLLLTAYMRWLAPDHRGTFRNVFKQIFTKRASTATGISYDPGHTVRSGSSITTQSGTIDNAFNVYCALRNMGYSISEAWDRIGAIFGDDSLNANHQGLFREFLVQVVQDLGMIYKSTSRARDEPVLFLGRYFVDPMYSYDSFADPMRTIGKLHLSSNKNVSVEQAAANKAWGYNTTDALTPILGTWAAKVLELTKLKFKNGTGEEQYKCSNAWPQKNKTQITEALAKVLNLSVGELLEKDKAVRAVTGLDQFPVLFDTTYEHKQLAVVNGNLVGTDLHENEQPTNNEQPSTSTRRLKQATGEGCHGNTNAVGKPRAKPKTNFRTAKQPRTENARHTPRLPRSNAGSRRSAPKHDSAITR